MPLISALMPTYNCRKFLGTAIASVLDQTYKDFELVVLDDGSTDGTPHLLASLARKDDRLRIVSRKNKGLVASRNELLELAKGDLLAWCDADDKYHPERFAKQVARFAADPELVAIGSDWQMIDEKDLPIKDLSFPHDAEACAKFMIDVDNSMWFPTVMMRADAARRVGGFRMPFVIAEDYDFHLRLMEFGKIGNIPEVLCYYRQHLKSTVSSRHWQAPVYAQFARKLALERREKGTDAVQRGEKVSLEFGPPLSHRENHVHLHTKWAWWALMNGHVKTARRHALLTATHAPLSLHTWRLVYCAVRGH